MGCVRFLFNGDQEQCFHYSLIYLSRKELCALKTKIRLQFVVFAGTTLPLGIRLDFDISFPSGIYFQRIDETHLSLPAAAMTGGSATTLRARWPRLGPAR
jgi:hypothetical protein